MRGILWLRENIPVSSETAIVSPQNTLAERQERTQRQPDRQEAKPFVSNGWLSTSACRIATLCYVVDSPQPSLSYSESEPDSESENSTATLLASIEATSWRAFTRSPSFCSIFSTFLNFIPEEKRNYITSSIRKEKKNWYNTSRNIHLPHFCSHI